MKATHEIFYVLMILLNMFLIYEHASLGNFYWMSISIAASCVFIYLLSRRT